MQKSHKTRWFQSFLTPRFVILGICLLNLLVSYLLMRQRDLELQASGYSISGGKPVMVEPFLLLAASSGLLINRWWSVLLAMFASLRVIYLLGYLSWTAVHFAHGVPLFSWQATEALWYVVYEPRPQYLFELALGVAIFIYSLVLIGRSVFAKSAIPIAGG